MAATQLPAPLRLTPAFPFVGRSRELATLRSLLPWAEGEGRRVALLGGEAGSGKSRLVREFAHEAAGAGALVLYGACDAVVRTPYGPFVEVLDHLARHTDAALLRDDVGISGGELARLVPELPLRVGSLPAPLAADPDTERHRLHTAVADLLANVGRRGPVVVVVEDAHWADAPTLLLLRHLARGAREARLLLLATFRDTESELPRELSETLADLRRSDDVVRLRLAGLSPEDVAEFVRRAAGSDVGPPLPELAQTISYLTEGNAFLLCELWRTLLETEVVAVVDGSVTLTRPLAELETPDSVREVVSQRLARVAPATRKLLELAAVAGPEFEHAVLRRAAELDEDELRPALDEAVRSGLIEEVQSGTLGYRFTHELVRWALYDGLTTLRRAELHLRVGEALEAVHASSRTPPLADLAHHFTAAAPVGASPRAVEYNIRAAEAAAAALAFEETAARLEKALDLGVENDRERANVLVELGTAYYRAGKWLDAHEAFSSAAELARTLGDADILARSAIGFEEACWRPKIYDRDALEMLEEAAAALGERESPTRVLVLAGLSRSLADLGNQERAGIVRDNAIGIARRIGDPRALGRVLLGAYWARGSSTHDEILEMLTEAKQLGEELGDEELRAEAVAWRVLTLVAQCELTAAHAELATLLEAAEQTRQPFMLHIADQFSSALALCDGRLAEAESRAESCYELSRAMTGWDASGVYGVQMFSLRREQGRLAELAPVIRLLAGGEEKPGVWRPGLVALLTELGMESEARRELARLRAEGLEQFRAALWLAALTYLTDACAALGEEEVAAHLYPELEKYAGENVLIGYMVSCYGAADRYLGMLAATLGEWEKAEGHFEAALELNRRMGVSTWVAHSAYEYGRMLLRRGTADDTSHSRVLLAEAAALAEQIGMPVLLGRVQALGAAVAPASALPDGLSAREAEILQLVAHGLSNREIGKALFISEHTAANHIRNILRKTGCANRTEAASYAHRHGLIEV